MGLKNLLNLSNSLIILEVGMHYIDYWTFMHCSIPARGQQEHTRSFNNFYPMWRRHWKTRHLISDRLSNGHWTYSLTGHTTLDQICPIPLPKSRSMESCSPTNWLTYDRFSTTQYPLLDKTITLYNGAILIASRFIMLAGKTEPFMNKLKQKKLKILSLLQFSVHFQVPEPWHSFNLDDGHWYAQLQPAKRQALKDQFSKQ